MQAAGQAKSDPRPVTDADKAAMSVSAAEGAVPSAAAEAQAEQLVTQIQPSAHSEERRAAIIAYVHTIIERCFAACKVLAFAFGSVPLKTYLPDGDIDLSLFQAAGPSVHATWTERLAAALEAEAARKRGLFRVCDVQVINAEVNLVKCLVDDTVVDISLQTLGGLCTVLFLESIDQHIQCNHLFKRSIILVKAWCYYESRLLGAHHGLISTYALEVLVLYIFNFYRDECTSPLRVLATFLRVFSSFDWDTKCITLQGPVPIGMLAPDAPPPPAATDARAPSPNPGPPSLDPLLLEGLRLQFGQEALGIAPPGRHFQAKHLNILDPLLSSNNLGRSVSKASFSRIRKALAHGAHALDALLTQPPDEAAAGVERFFRNTLRAVQQHRAARAAPSAAAFPPAPLPPLLQEHSEHVMQMLQRQGGATATNGAAATEVHPGVGLLPTGLPTGVSVRAPVGGGRASQQGEGGGGADEERASGVDDECSTAKGAPAGEGHKNPPTGHKGRVPPPTRPSSVPPPTAAALVAVPSGSVDLLSGHLLLLRYQLNLALQCQSGPLFDNGGRGEPARPWRNGGRAPGRSASFGEARTVPTSPMPGRFPLMMPAPPGYNMRAPPRNHSASQLAALEHSWSNYVVNAEALGGMPMAIYPMPHPRMAMSVPTSPRMPRAEHHHRHHHPPHHRGGHARGPSPHNGTRSPSPTGLSGRRPSFAAAAALPELPRGNGSLHTRSVGSPRGGRGSERGRASEPGSLRGASLESAPVLRGGGWGRAGRGGGQAWQSASKPPSAGVAPSEGSVAEAVTTTTTPGTPPAQQSPSFVLADEDFPVLGGTPVAQSQSPSPGEWAARAKPGVK